MWIYVVPDPQTPKTHLTIVVFATIACILIFQYCRLNMQKLYRTIIRTVIILAIILNIIIRWG